MATATPNPRVGVSAIVLNSEGKILVGKRKGSHGAGTYQFPGGHLEYAEGLVDCAMREVKEETDLDVIASKSGLSTNDVFVREVKHYITMFVLCKMKNRDAVATVMEPEKCECWEWWSPEKLFLGKETGVVEETGEDGEVMRCELFLPLKNLLKEFATVDDLKRAFQ